MNTFVDHNEHTFANVFGDPIIMVHLSQYLSTLEFIHIVQTNRECRHILDSNWHVLRKAVTAQPNRVVISNTFLRESFFHFGVISMSLVGAFLDDIRRSHIVIENLTLSVESMPDFEQFILLMKRGCELSNLSDDIIMCQFRFPITSTKEYDESGIEYSSSISIPGGTLRLFKRAVSALYPGNNTDQPASVTGIDMDTAQVWLCRVFSVSDRRLDLKAGTTRSDVLRVPNGSMMGTWTDLCPVFEHSPVNNPDNIYFVEFMKNISVK
jgi:hypothetical protein